MKKRVNDYFLTGVFVATALLFAAAGLKAYSVYFEKKVAKDAKRQSIEEVKERNAIAQARVAEMESEILVMAKDTENLQEFIDGTVMAANEVQNRKMEESKSGDSITVSQNSVSGNATFFWSVSGDDSVSGNRNYGHYSSVSGMESLFSGSTVSGSESVSSNYSVSGNSSVSGDWTVSGNGSVSGNGTVSGNGSVSGNGTASGNEIVYGNGTVSGNGDMTLEEKRVFRSSYEETLEVNQADKELIAENPYDFSQMKIACLGDSITAASNLGNEEESRQYAYPTKLKELLGLKEVYNMGIGGSSIGRYWADAFVERYKEIPQDVDIIIVMGGTNDGFCVSDNEFGNLSDREEETFCGDLDELMSGLRQNYPEAVIFFATPLPNILHDYLMTEQEYLLPQRYFAEVIKILAAEYRFELVDLYNSNILDSHDAKVISEYLPDGVHGNQEGYQILAQHFAAEIVKYYNFEDNL